MPINYKLYHPDWKDIIRPDILRRDNYKCKHCGLKNRLEGYRDGKGFFVECDEFMKQWAIKNHLRIFKIVLTISHLDHDITNNEYTNLAALCQKCHMLQDHEQHRLSRIAFFAKRK